MWAAIFELTAAPDNRAAFQSAWEEFASLRERQQGFRGAIELDAGEGRLLGLVLWENAEAHNTAHATSDAASLRAALDRARSLLAAPTKGLAAGEMTGNSLSDAGPWETMPELAFINEAVITPGQRAAYDAENRELWAVRAQQPGFCGSIEFDAGEERIAWLAIWANRAALQAAREALMPVVDRAHIHVQSRGQFGSGAIVRNTITGRAVSASN